MLKDHLIIVKKPDLEKGILYIRGQYYLKSTKVCDISDDELIVAGLEEDAVHEINQQLTEDIFEDYDFTNEDIAYIFSLDHKQLERARNVANLTKFIPYDTLVHILCVYSHLAALSMFGENDD